MKRMSGLKLLDEREGTGTPAQKGDLVVYNSRIFLNHGEEVSLNDIQANSFPKTWCELRQDSHSSITASCSAVARRLPESSMRSWV